MIDKEKYPKDFNKIKKYNFNEALEITISQTFEGCSKVKNTILKFWFDICPGETQIHLLGSVHRYPAKISTYANLETLFISKIAERLTVEKKEVEEFLPTLLKEENLSELIIQENLPDFSKPVKINKENLIETLEKAKCILPLEKLQNLYDKHNTEKQLYLKHNQR
ncbi:hypothetical protein [Alphaproteobacteria bacterium endosymbiont of Tiliacea citrago]|uniref:hypothetical protein n=1 Tax=Alphaproteobacteria bacterium endosymbiont of Tiliacea citrago TaxID=3077944 RepID=UPI00313D3F73